MMYDGYQVIRGIKVGSKLPGVPPQDRIICSGRRPDGTGNRCGKRYHDGCMCCGGWCSALPGGCKAPHVRHHVTVELVEAARAAGWRVGPARTDGSYPTMCPKCAAPDPALVRMCSELFASVRRGKQLDLF
jgi:hypothetical protein